MASTLEPARASTTLAAVQRTITLDPAPDLRLTLGHLNGGSTHPDRPLTGSEGWRASRTLENMCADSWRWQNSLQDSNP